MKTKLRFKELQKKYFIWQDLEFLRNVRSNAIVNEFLFETKKITKVEQEFWFNNIYSLKEDYYIFIIYHEGKKCPIGYVNLEIDSIIHRRIEFGYIVSPEFNYIKCDRAILRWIENKAKVIEFNMNKIWCYVLNGNDKRLEVLSDNGFEVDCFLRKHVYKNNYYWDAYIMSKLL